MRHLCLRHRHLSANVQRDTTVGEACPARLSDEMVGARRSWANSLSQVAANGPQEGCDFASIRWHVEICGDPEFVFGSEKES
jgi:hypothetical protein